MFQKIRRWAAGLMCCIRNIPPACIFVPAMLLGAAFIIRLVCGGGCVVYKFTGNVGLFPGGVLYTLGYVIRLILCGILLASALFSYRIQYRVRAAVFAAALAVMMLFEFKLIFTMCRFFIAALMCIACAAAAFLSLVNQRGCERAVSLAAIAYIIFEGIFFVQVITLIFCF